MLTGQFANMTTVQEVIQFLDLNSTSIAVLGGIDEVPSIYVIQSSPTTIVDINVSKQGPDGELKGAKALWLTVFTKVLFALKLLHLS